MTLAEILEAPAMPGGEARPVFLEPWHAEIFSIAVTLHRQGAFEWSEWVELFSSTLRDTPAEAGESIEAAYYRRWLLTLERMVDRKRLASPDDVARRKEEWRRAYLRTPHGKPVELARAHAAGSPDPHDHADGREHHHDHDHHHDHHHAAQAHPVAVSPARNHSGAK